MCFDSSKRPSLKQSIYSACSNCEFQKLSLESNEMTEKKGFRSPHCQSFSFLKRKLSAGLGRNKHSKVESQFNHSKHNLIWHKLSVLGCWPSRSTLRQEEFMYSAQTKALVCWKWAGMFLNVRLVVHKASASLCFLTFVIFFFHLERRVLIGGTRGCNYCTASCEHTIQKDDVLLANERLRGKDNLAPTDPRKWRQWLGRANKYQYWHKGIQRLTTRSTPHYSWWKESSWNPGESPC